MLQTENMSMNKSTSNKWLAAHVLTYSVCFVVFGSWQFVLLNGIIHFCVDWATSRMTKHYYKKGNIHVFFVVVGFDQLLHTITLMLLGMVFLGE
jgi:hypothetical protein